MKFVTQPFCACPLGRALTKTALVARRLAELSDTERNAVAAKDKTVAAVIQSATFAPATTTRLTVEDGRASYAPWTPEGDGDLDGCGRG